jgi:hypothetical protein
MDNQFNGLDLNLGNLARISNAITRSISPENFHGEKGKGGMATEGTGSPYAKELGQGWKISPSINVAGNSVVTVADISGPGAIQHIWLTVHPSHWRRLVLRAYWDGEETPSIEVPLGDFFANGWCERCNISSLPVTVNPAGGFNCYWEMPFRKHALLTIENLTEDEVRGLYYSIDYTLTEVPADRAYFHAQYRLSKPLPFKEDHTILDGIRGQGHYVGTYMAIAVHENGWWGEGEIKFFMDGDTTYPTICGTGTEDYFGGAWNFEFPKGEYCIFSTPYQGLPQVIKPDGLYRSTQRFGMYRWHIQDPIRFQKDLRVTIQDLGWVNKVGGVSAYLARQDTIATTAFWYQLDPHAPFPCLPPVSQLEVVGQ